MSLAAPVVTFSVEDDLLGNATAEHDRQARFEECLVWEVSRSGNCMVTPSARPRR
jgi:hypothetical protein